MRTLGGGESSSRGMARLYSETWPDLLDALVIDDLDASEVDAIAAYGMRAHVAPTLIAEQSERRRLAQEILELAGAL